MNPFLIMLKQMRQRALSTWLTLLSVALGVGLAVAIMITRAQGQALFGQTDYGYDVLVGPKGSPLQLVLNTVYHIDAPPGTISYSLYENCLPRGPWFPYVRVAVPVAVGDNYHGHAIIGTLPRLLGADDHGVVKADTAFEVRPGQRYAIADGRCFEARKFEAVVGCDVAAKAGLGIGGTFQATHGLDPAGTDLHPEVWKVVGVLARTHTAQDQVILIPLISFYAIGDHKKGLEQIAKVRAMESNGKPGATVVPAATEAAPAAEDAEGDTDNDGPAAYTLNADGNIVLSVGKEKWQISAILVNSRRGVAPLTLTDAINKGTAAAAVNPASVMASFFKNFLEGSTRVLLLLSSLVTVVAAVSILVSIYNSVSARNREIAILRALGATRGRILLLICLEAGAIGLLGGFIGILLGHALAAGGSIYLTMILGEGIAWWQADKAEWIYWAVVVGLAVLAGLVPALKAYRTPVAANLTSS